MGYARQRGVAISPLSKLPSKTLFHELALIELDHTAEADFSDSERTPRNLREVAGVKWRAALCARRSPAREEA